MPKKVYKLDPNTLKILIDEGLITEEQIYKLIKPNISKNRLMTIGESISAFTQLSEKKSAKNTISSYRQYTESFLKFLYSVEDMDDIENQVLKEVVLADIENWFNYLLSVGYKESKLPEFRSGLTKYFNFLEQNGFKMPDLGLIKLSKRESLEIDALREDEIKQIANSSPTLRGKTLIIFMYETGIKRNELVECKKSHINFDNRTVDIYKRGKFDRVGYLSEEGVKLIKNYLKAWEHEVEELNNERANKAANFNKVYEKVAISEYLFQTYVADRISYATINRDINSAVHEYYSNKGYDTEQLSKMQNMITTETFRHSRRVFYLSEGMAVQQVKALIGDANITDTYRHLPVAQKLYPEKFRNS